MANNVQHPRKTKKDAKALNKTAEKLIKQAKEGGAEQNYFFQTTFDKYLTQLEYLDELQRRIERHKGLAKGYESLQEEALREKMIIGLITEFNKTSTAANNTVQTLLKIIITFAEGPVMSGGEEDIDL